MKILVISSHPLQDNRISKMLKTIQKADNEVIYVNISLEQSVSAGWFEGISIITVKADFSKKYLFKDAYILLKILKLIKKEKPNVVHVHDPYFIPVFKTAKKHGAITVFDKHEAYEVIEGFAGKSGAWCEKIYSKYIDGIVYVSQMQEKYLEKFNYKSMKCIPNYQSEEAFSKAMNVSHKGIRLFYAGDLSDVTRNSSLMLELVNRVLQEFPDVYCTIAGKTRDKQIENKINEMQKNLSNFHYEEYLLYDKVIFETRKADIGLYLTKYDKNNIGSSPNKINEYLMAGIAVFAQGRFSDWNLIDGQAGKVFDYDANIEEMYYELSSMIKNSNTIDAMKKRSKELGKSRTWESIENRYLELYSELNNAKKG